MIFGFSPFLQQLVPGVSDIPFMNFSLFGNTVLDYLIAFLVFSITLIALRLIKYVVIRELSILCKKTKNDLDDMLIEAVRKVFKRPFYLLVSLYVGIGSLTVTPTIELYLYYMLVMIGTYYGIKFVSTFVDYGTRKYMEGKEESDKADSSAIHLLSNITKSILWLIAAMLILSNLGYNINTLIAGLGVGGIAIAFALQSILADMFASFSIYFDKPFRTGDFIVVGDDMGTVKKIGLKSTRITTLEGDELVISNKELTESRVHNYKKLKKRRKFFTIGVEYSTPVEKLKKIPVMIKDIIQSTELLELDRVHFKEFGDFSLKFEIAYYINSQDYNTYMDKQQEINLKIKERFEKEGIEMAFPTQKVLVDK